MTVLIRRAATNVARSVVASLLLSATLGAAASDVGSERVRIPLETSGVSSMLAGVFLPEGKGPFPVLVYSHGRSGTPLERTYTKIPNPRGHLSYWLGKGFAVVAPIRPGYGETGGNDREDSGVRLDMFGNCWGYPNFDNAAAAAASALLGTVEWVRHQSWADPGRIVLAGTSMGGLASIAAAARNPPGVVGYINFAGGTGGNGTRAPEHSCGSGAMESLMATLGRTNHVPGLWLYAQNDQYWGARWPVVWYRAFNQGASVTRFVMTDPVPNIDGHQLLAHGARLWNPLVESFLAEHGF